MKLISMTDFVFLLRNKTTMELCTFFTSVFKEPKWRGSVQESASEFLAIDAIQWRLVGEYAKFLRKPLTLRMFVPCNEDGNVLEEPLNYKEWRKKSLNTPYDLDLSKYEQYQQAKERVLFEGFTVERFINKGNPCYVVSNGENEVTFHIGLYTFSKGVDFAKTIEDLTRIKPTLTPQALKQIGI